MRYEYLKRFSDPETGDGSFGRLRRWFTVEDDNLGNAPNVSSIPPGAYLCVRTTYEKGGYETFEVTGVPGRSRILFHVANSEEDVEGCIGVGMRLGVLAVHDEDAPGRPIRQKMAVLDSGAAFRAFMEYFAEVDRWVLIVESSSAL